MTNDELQALIDKATVDTYDEYEERCGFFAMLEDHVVFPFKAKIIGKDVTVVGIELRGREAHIGLVVQQEGMYHVVDICDISIDPESVVGGAWIAAYKKWAGCQ